MKLWSVSIRRRGLLYKYKRWTLGNPKNVSGRRYCSLLLPKFIYSKLNHTLNTALSKCCNQESSHSSALMFANVSTDTELTLQCDIPRCDKECDLMKLRSVGI